MSFFLRSKPVDLMYVEGVGNIVDSLTKWHQKEDFLAETSLTFSGQLFDFCTINNLNVVCVSSYPETTTIKYQNFLAFSKKKMRFGGTVGYHLSQLLHGLYLIKLAVKYRPKYFHITSGETYFFMLAPLKLLGIKVFPHIHNTFWAKGFPSLSKSQSIMFSLDSWFLKNIATCVFCCSPEIKRQIEKLTNNNNCLVHIFKPQFHRSSFVDVPQTMLSDKPFTVVFAGRIERNKGVFDILAMAVSLKNENVIFNICGNGSDLSNLRSECIQLDLEDSVFIHGRLDRPKLLDIYKNSHTVIIPTRSNFPEGFAMVAAESILLERPIITSQIVPALELLKNAAVEVEAENISSYVDAIKLLMSNKAVYKTKQEACIVLREQFLDRKVGLTKVLQQSLDN